MKRKAKIFYTALDDFWRKEEKLAWLRDNPIEKIAFERIEPDAKNNWINQTDNDWDSLLPLIDKDVKAGKSEEAVFKLFSRGIATQRDEWVYDFSKDALEEKVNYLVEVYEATRKNENFPDKMKIKWDRELDGYRDKNIKKEFSKKQIYKTIYRPYVSQFLYYDRNFNGMTYLWRNLFRDNQKNTYITISGIGSNKTFQSVALNSIVGLDFLEKTQSLPLYTFDSDNQKHENITDWGLAQFQTHYETETRASARVRNADVSGGKSARKGERRENTLVETRVSVVKDESTLADARVSVGTTQITKQDIFYYTYAMLHSPVYRKKYEQNLKREFPRLPFYADFFQWRDWGKELMNLHINYETQEPFPLERNDLDLSAKRKTETRPLGSVPLFADDIQLDDESIVVDAEASDSKNKSTLANARVSVSKEESILADARVSVFVAKPQTKLRADKTNGAILIDSITTLSGVPPIAWEYKLGNRSALEWILDQYKEKTPQDATIRERFNTYKFADYKEQTIDLLKRVCNVSVKTMEIINQMPQPD